MKQFFKMMFASALGVFLAIGLVILILTFGMIGMVASMSSQSEFVPAKNSVFKLSLNGELTETSVDNPYAQLFGQEQGLSVKDIVKSIRAAKENKNVKGIYLESGVLFSAGIPSIDAIRRELIDFKESGKFIVAYSDNYTQGAYYLCSVADKIFVNPKGSVLVDGLSSQITFYKGLLNKIGVEMEIFKVGTYKGAVEPYMLDKLSDANREQITSYQQSIWGNITKAIAGSRNITQQAINDFADNGYFYAATEKAVEVGLVDELKYRPEAEEYVKEQAGQKGDKLKVASLDKMKNIKVSTRKSSNEVAILYAEGNIQNKVLSSLAGNNVGITDDMVDALIKLRKDDKVKAVVFRVNSRGGDAYLSEQIWHEVVELKKVKPIVVSMSDYAASGGYYISCAANKIIAEPNTLTGSIGIFGSIPNFSGLYKKLDLTIDEVKTNTFGGFLDVNRPWRDDERALMQANIERGYDLFITRCADGRGKTKEKIDQIGQGRVWTGEQALERGLVDALGGLDEAIVAAAELAEVTDYQVTNVFGNKDFFQQFFEKQLENVKVSVVKSVIGEEEFNHLQALNEFKRNTGILARIPYEFELAPL
ncbi:signal peptide peptidase SppA [Bacteroidia bacterium]|nr:signal peptide peptidase SppA [Bacteroidia bacterium]